MSAPYRRYPLWAQPPHEPGPVPDLTVQIQERAYRLFQSSGYQHGHALEHWLEAERQLKESQSSEHSEHKESPEETDDASRSR